MKMHDDKKADELLASPANKAAWTALYDFFTSPVDQIVFKFNNLCSMLQEGLEGDVILRRGDEVRVFSCGAKQFVVLPVFTGDKVVCLAGSSPLHVVTAIAVAKADGLVDTDYAAGMAHEFLVQTLKGM